MRRRQQAFTLVEVAVVLAIVGLLLGSLMYTLSAQTDQRGFEENRRRIDQARELLLSFAMVKGRLPCPARYTSSASNSAGLESFCPLSSGTCSGTETTTVQSHGNCSNYYDGYLPAATLGLTNVDAAGFAVDPWGNRIRYAVTKRNATGTCATDPPSTTTPLFTSSTTLRTYGVSCQPNDLMVCRSATGISSSDCGTSSNQIMSTSLVVAVVLSTGKNGATSGGSGTDEAANVNGDAVFVMHTPTGTSAANGEFDDQVTWITVGELMGRLITAGKLP